MGPAPVVSTQHDSAPGRGPVRGALAGGAARAQTPTPTRNPDLPDPHDNLAQWTPVGDQDTENGFKLQWEEYLRDVAAGRRHRHDLLSGARGVQLAELGLRSSAEGRRLQVPEITL